MYISEISVHFLYAAANYKTFTCAKEFSFQGVACHLQHLDNDFPVPQPKADGFFFCLCSRECVTPCCPHQKRRENCLDPKNAMLVVTFEKHVLYLAVVLPFHGN